MSLDCGNHHNPNATIEKLVEFIPGPDFPTGGVLVEPRESIIEAYKTGRGGFRLRAKWHREDTGRGTYQVVVTEIPYQVPKSKLVERLAELLQEKKIPLVGDIRDESTEEVRLVIEPKSRTVDPVVMMESLFRVSELEIRFGLNMNVLSHGQIPNVLSLRAYLNIDEVIRIIRFEDEPKQKLISRFGLTEVQAEAILNLRLRALSKLEEIEIKAEHDRLSKERRELQQLLASEDMQWQKIAEEVRETREAYSKKTELGRRRTSFAEPPEIEVDLEQVMVEKEPITVILSEKGWIRALKGHLDDLSKLDFKQGDRLKRAVKAMTTDKLLVFATNGKFYTLSGNELPGGRGHGEPIRLMIDLEESHDVLELFVHQPGRKLLVASTSGHGFVVPEDEVIASTRKGRQVLNVSEPDEAKVCVPAQGDMVATVGDNRKMLIFPLSEVNEMARGKGVILQRIKDGKLADVRVFNKADGLTWVDAAGRTFTLSANDLADWIGQRAQAGKVVPKGFPRSNRFGPAFG